MESDLLIFKSDEFGEIRTININGVPWFVGKDVATALGYNNSRDALNKHVETEDKGVAKCDTLGGKQNLTIINESGVYDLVFGSKLKSAKKFKHWVTSEILPTIRKTGGYVDGNRESEFIEKYFPSFTEETKLIMVKDLHKQNLEYKQQLTEQKPLVDFAEKVHKSDGLIDIGDMAKLLHEKNKIDIGRNRLFDFLRSQKILTGNNAPYQKYIEAGWFKTKEYLLEVRGELKPYIKVYVTGKGQLKITQLVLDNYNNLLDPAS